MSISRAKGLIVVLNKRIRNKNILKKYRYYTYNVTPRSVNTTIVAVES